ncbi:charged multivesicular body protein 4c isoform X2 [Lemur catta]|uniref:charged multivesicular body protein 4c isoform X2 n=1 Tax=Lemur catta TaxID=9447 RepID=UPI001E26D172|nr:charged multivesicular body protein 4c isoform X2 [Lemur catta]
MSKLGKFFKGGGPSKSRAAPSPQEALARLRETEEMLGKKQEYLENRIQRELALAKKHGTQNKRAALQALKRKKRFEKQLTQIDGTLSTIEFQREALENSHTNTEVLRNMGFAAKAMKTVHENMDLNKIDDLMQDITEQQDIAQEISEAFSQRIGLGDDFDEHSQIESGACLPPLLAGPCLPLRVDLCLPLRVDPCLPLRVDPCLPLRVDPCLPLRVDPCLPLLVDPCLPLRVGPGQCHPGGQKKRMMVSNNWQLGLLKLKRNFFDTLN